MRKVITSTLLIITLAFSNCNPFKISTSAGLNTARELPVSGKNGILIKQKLHFGEFRTTRVKRSWTEGQEAIGGATQVFWVSNSQKQQKLHFSLTDSANNTSEVFCLAKTRAEDWNIGANPNSIVNIMTDVLGIGVKSDNTYAVGIYLAKEPAPWQLLLDLQEAQRHSKKYIGYLAQDKNRFYTIHPITTLERSGKQSALPFGSVGYELRNKDGVALAAVSLMDKGKVYIASTDAKEKFLLANACAALLLHQVIG